VGPDELNQDWERGLKFPYGEEAMAIINIDARLQRARVRLLLGQPFFGALCLRLKLESAAYIPTMATDGRRILFSPEFVARLSAEELEGTLAHEVMHCALGHHCRRQEREPGLWNQAADLAINPLLIANGFTLPAGALIDARFANLSAEEIYARLERDRGGRQAQGGKPSPTEPPGGNQNNQTPNTASPAPSHCGKPKGRSAGQGTDPSAPPSGFGEVMDATDQKGEPASPAEQARQQREWSIAAEQAVRSAKSCGKHPAGMERTIEESRQPRQDWRAILRDFIVSQSPVDYCWSPPNRRFVSSGLYLPGMERRQLGTLVVAVDTSGSIRPGELARFAAEINAISEEAQPENIRILYCDSAVQGAEEFAAGEAVELRPRGGGGTDFRPAFAWIEDQGVAPACMVYLTDLACKSFPEAPDYPVLWVTESRRRAPFGETIRIVDA
jgi:predicted metal-dependent peptidase